MESHLMSLEQAGGMILTGIYTSYFLVPFIIAVVGVGQYLRWRKKLKLIKIRKKVEAEAEAEAEAECKRNEQRIENGIIPEKIDLQFDKNGMIIPKGDNRH